MTDHPRNYDWADYDDEDPDYGDHHTFLFLALIAIVGVLVVGGILFAITITAGHQAQLR